MPLNRWPATIALATLLALSGCTRTDNGAEVPAGDDASAVAPPASASSESPAPGATSLDATWQGVLPCADCDGIQTRLRLVADDQGRRYELQETYLNRDGGEVFEVQGAWVEETAVLDGQSTVAYRLDTGGASRWFSLLPDGALEMLDGPQRPMADTLAHRLQRM
jgi:uncharacterized lipoprotein NlpE involved in copper resistance